MTISQVQRLIARRYPGGTGQFKRDSTLLRGALEELARKGVQMRGGLWRKPLTEGG